MSTRKLRSRAKINYSKMASGEATDEETGSEIADINNNNDQNKSSVKDDGGDIFGRELFQQDSDSLEDNDDGDSSSESENDVSELEVSNVEKRLELMKIEERRLKKMEKYRRLSQEAMEVEKSIKTLKKKQNEKGAGKKKVTNVTLRGMKDVMEEVDRLMDQNKLKEKKQKKIKKKIESSSDEESEASSVVSCDSSDEPEIEEKEKKTKKVTGKLKSGKNKRITSDVKFPQEWPQSHLSLQFVNKDKKYEELTQTEFCAGYVGILENCSGTELTYRTAHLKELMYLTTQYQWRYVLNYHAAVLLEIERGHLRWDGNFLALQNATLAGGFLNSQKGASGQKRGAASSSNSNGGVVFCRAYQTSSCTHAGDHQGDFRGESRLLKHICAKCWLENKNIAAHAEKSGVCPLDS